MSTIHNTIFELN